jgi:hypothetical protein
VLRSRTTPFTILSSSPASSCSSPIPTRRAPMSASICTRTGCTVLDATAPRDAAPPNHTSSSRSGFSTREGNPVRYRPFYVKPLFVAPGHSGQPKRGRRRSISTSRRTMISSGFRD